MKINTLVKLSLIIICVLTGYAGKAEQTSKKGQFVKITKTPIVVEAYYEVPYELEFQNGNSTVFPEKFTGIIRVVDDIENNAIIIYINRDTVIIRPPMLKLFIEDLDYAISRKVPKVEETPDGGGYYPGILSSQGVEFGFGTHYCETFKATLCMGFVYAPEPENVNPKSIYISINNGTQSSQCYLYFHISFGYARVLAEELRKYEKTISPERKG